MSNFRDFSLTYFSLVITPSFTYRGSGLPDGSFSNQKSQFGSILEGLATVDVGIHILWPFGKCYDHLV
jgi:hypothetical protein